MTNRRTKQEEGQHFIALFPGLVDIVEDRDHLAFMIIDRGKLEVIPTVALDGVTYHPPPRAQLTWAQFGIPRFEGVKQAFDNSEDPIRLLDSTVSYLEPLAALPAHSYHYFMALWVMLTYLADHPEVERIGIVNLFGDMERGKSRQLTGLGGVVYRPNLTETVNEATLFRFADYLGGTLLLDVSNFWPQVQRRGSEEFFLIRFEKGRQIHRVKHPEAEPFKDLAHYEVFGPTVIATNHLAPPKFLSRTFPISMPLKPGRYPQPDPEMGIQLRERLLAFRARMLGTALPEPELVGSGRWQDISAPLTQLAKLMPAEMLAVLLHALEDMGHIRHEQERESVEAQVARCLAELRHKVTGGKLEMKLIRILLNEGIPERFQVSPQKVGRVLSAFGFKKTKNRQYVYWDQGLVDALQSQYGVE